MAGKSDYFENAVLNALRNVPLSVANVYVALFTTLPSEAGVGGVEPAGGGYARQAVMFGTPAGGSIANTADALFPQASANWGTVVGFGLYDSLAAGNLLYFDYLGAAAKLPFAADAMSNTIESPGHGFVNGDRVVVSTEFGGALPGGLAEATLYYVVGAAAAAFQVSPTTGGAAVDLTTGGSGYVQRVTPKQIDSGDQFKFPAGQLTVTEA